METKTALKENKEHAGIEKKKEAKTAKPVKSNLSLAKTVVPNTLSNTPSNALSNTANGKLALVLIRGFIRMRKDIMNTLYALRLRRKHACVVIEDNPVNRAAAIKCKDYIAFGEITEETYNLLVEKRGRKDKDGKLKKFFSLSPPKGGFERKGIKNPFSNGGALGYRGIKMNELIRRMI